MGLFSRKKRKDVENLEKDADMTDVQDGKSLGEVDDVNGVESDTKPDGRDDLESSDSDSDSGSDSNEEVDVAGAARTQSADVGAAPGGQAIDDEPAEGATTDDVPADDVPADDMPAERGEHLREGPYDETDAPEEDRIDLGGLQVPTIDGMELRMEVDQRTSAVTGANLVIGGSSVQVQAFAAPKSRGLWDDVRTSLRDSVVKQGGTAETRPGVFGTELITRLPVKRADGRTGYRPARFIGIDGRRWFLRAILTGKALSDKEQARVIETVISRLVVVRGGEAMAPQELIPLNLPGQRPGLSQMGSSSLDPLARGPEITQIG